MALRHCQPCISLPTSQSSSYPDHSTRLQLPGMAAPAGSIPAGLVPSSHSPALPGCGATHTLLSQPDLGPFQLPGRCLILGLSDSGAPGCQFLAGTVGQQWGARAATGAGPQGATCSCCFLTPISFFP